MGKTRKEIKEKIMAKQVQIRKNEIPDGWSIEAADIINRVNYQWIYNFKKNKIKNWKMDLITKLKML